MLRSHGKLPHLAGIYFPHLLGDEPTSDLAHTLLLSVHSHACLDGAEQTQARATSNSHPYRRVRYR